MNGDQAKALRTPLPAAAIGKLPRTTCKKCSDSRSKVCDEHKKQKCKECGNFMTTAHIHLDYAGHAAITDRLLEVDPEWTWEPMAVGPNGEPLSTDGGLWIKLTVCGVTRPGYGDATGGKGPKEMIGDALRNAAMRFGVGLDLWSKADLHAVPEVDPFEALESALLALTPEADRAKVEASVAAHREKAGVTVDGHKVWLTRCIEAAEAKGSAAPSAPADTSGDTEPSAGAGDEPPVSQAVWGEPESTPAPGSEGAVNPPSEPPSPYQAPASVPAQKPASAAQKKALNALIGRVREQAGRITTAELWAYLGKTPDTPEDGEHFAPLRESLTLHEASELIEHLKTLEEFAVADGVLEPRRAA